MKTLLRLLSIFSFFSLLNTAAWGQSLLVDNFTGLTVGGNLANQSGWVKSGSGPDATIGNATPLSYPNYNGGTGEYVIMPTSSATSSRVYKGFTATTGGTGTVYYSFLLRLTSAGTLGTSGYFLSLGDPATGSAYFARVSAKASGSGFNIGVSKQSNTPTFGTTVYNFNQTYVVVVRYTYLSGTTSDDAVYIWVNPSLTSEPSTASADATISTGTDGASIIGNIHWHNRSLENPSGAFDGLRVAYGTTSAVAWSSLIASATPVWTSGWPKAENAAGPTFSAKANINMPGTSYFVVLPNGATAPSSAQVKAGQDASGTPLANNLKGTIICAAGNTEYTSTVTGLSLLTTYDVYFIAEDNLGNNLQASPSMVSVVTTDISAPLVSSPTATNKTTNSADLGGTIITDGGSAITERGTVWSTTSPVTILDKKLIEGGTSTGTFSHNRSSLPGVTQIFYAAYATNSIGTTLSTESSFYTITTEPTASSSAIVFSNFAGTTLTVGWTPGDGNNHLVVVKSGSAVSSNPIDGIRILQMLLSEAVARSAQGNMLSTIQPEVQLTLPGLSKAHIITLLFMNLTDLQVQRIT